MRLRTSVNRAERLRLTRRVELARHAADLLRAKEEALQRERTRLAGHAERAASTWRLCWDAAATALYRARLLGAGDELRRIVADHVPSATIRVGWESAMGIEYPSEVDVSPSVVGPLSATASMAPARVAFVDLLEAAADHAAARAALKRVDDEVLATRRRRRAIERRLVPDLESALNRLDLQLDESDRSAAVRTQMAAKIRGESE